MNKYSALAKSSKFITHEGHTWLVIVGQESYILADKDLVHQINKLDESSLLGTTIERKEGDETFITWGEVELSLKELLELEDSEVVTTESLKEWIHYFGVKSRINENYHIFYQSLREIGFNDLSMLPKWESKWSK